MPDLKRGQEKGGKRHGIFSNSEFTFDHESNTYICPAGKRLRLKSLRLKKQSMDYSARASDCSVCELKSQCTRNKIGRTIKRHLRQDELEAMRAMGQTPKGKQDLKTRQHLMERSFALAVPLGFKRARWRRLWRVKIQEYLTAAIQNIKRMIQTRKKPAVGVALKIAARMETCFQASIPRTLKLQYSNVP